MDWTKNCNSSTVDIPAFVNKMQQVVAGKEIDWICPFCGGRVSLLEQTDHHKVIGCEECDMRITLDG